MQLFRRLFCCLGVTAITFDIAAAQPCSVLGLRMDPRPPHICYAPNPVSEFELEIRLRAQLVNELRDATAAAKDFTKEAKNRLASLQEARKVLVEVVEKAQK
jgi:hypothetical protein